MPLNLIKYFSYFLLAFMTVMLIWMLFLFVNDDSAIANGIPLRDLVISIAVAVALLTLAEKAANDQIREQFERSREYLDASVTLFGYSLNALKLDSDGVVYNNRMNWLNSARFLASAQNMSKKITVEHHTEIYKEELESLRSSLYELLIGDDHRANGFDKNYFAEDGRELAYSLRDRAPISESSAVYLYRFVRFVKEYKDPLADVSKPTRDEINTLLTFGPKGVGHYFKVLWEKRNNQKWIDPDIEKLEEADYSND